MKLAAKVLHHLQSLTTIQSRSQTNRAPSFDALEDKLLLSSYYVATTGSNTATGTATSPWATIQQAANTVKPGDTVYVAPGTYTTTANGINTSTSGTSTAPITFISTVKWGAKLYNPGGAQEQSVWHNSGNYVAISGFDMTGNGAKEQVWAGILNMGSYCSFIGNYVHDIAIPNGLTSGGLAGISTYDGSSSGSIPGHNVISGNFITRIGTPGGGNLWHGIYEDAPYAIITNNICADNMSTGITDGNYSTNMQITNNVCVGNGNAGIWIGGDDIAVEDYDVVANNICAYNGWGIYEDADAGDDAAIGYHNQYLNNCIYDNGDGGIHQQSGDLYPASGTVTGSPQFVNYQANGTGNYELTAGSPCIGAGTSTDMPTTDFLGVARPAGGPYDIGAYQYITSTTTPPTVTSDSPGNNATGVPVSTSCAFTFSEPVQSSTINFTLTSAAGSVITTALTYNATTDTATFAPTSALAYSTVYTATVSGVTDQYGNVMVAPVTETFTTVSAPATKATINVTGYNVTYTGTAHTATGTAVGIGGVNVANDLTINSTHTNAGTYTDTWVFNATTNPNYNPNYTTQSGTVRDIINRAPLIVSANNETMVQGSAVPALTISYMGFVDGQTATSLTTIPTATTTATKRSTPGKYTITVKGAVDPNYTISYVPAIMTVTKKA